MLGNRDPKTTYMRCDRGHGYWPEQAVLGNPEEGYTPITPCPTCNDLSFASDWYKDDNGTRPHSLTESQLLGWYDERQIRATKERYKEAFGRELGETITLDGITYPIVF